MDGYEGDYTFYNGQKIQRIIWPDDSECISGKNNIEKIEVVMEYGQMAGVPWFAVWINGEVKFKHNAAHIASVEL